MIVFLKRNSQVSSSLNSHLTRSESLSSHKRKTKHFLPMIASISMPLDLCQIIFVSLSFVHKFYMLHFVPLC